ncbi:unnamed protein product [Protopolystoma xenopodis]|uniref:Uncharacterized protein n=1 Tax=Protopolystoma xenopodis TaxID=117903 RepID=A0A448WQ85_9PLAT|nr:unnamed protein product [Protopolystoma xenopodis]
MSYPPSSRFLPLMHGYFKRADGLVLVYDVGQEDGYVNLRSWYQRLEILVQKAASAVGAASALAAAKSLGDNVNGKSKNCSAKDWHGRETASMRGHANLSSRFDVDTSRHQSSRPVLMVLGNKADIAHLLLPREEQEEVEEEQKEEGKERDKEEERVESGVTKEGKMSSSERAASKKMAQQFAKVSKT